MDVVKEIKESGEKYRAEEEARREKTQQEMYLRRELIAQTVAEVHALLEAKFAHDALGASQVVAAVRAIHG